MKMYEQEYFNRQNIINLLTELSHSDTQLYLAVDVMESMRITSFEEAVKDKLSIYNCYVNHTLKYTEAAKIQDIENIVREFLCKHCTVAAAILKNNLAISLNDFMDQCSLYDPRIVTSAKCVFAFLYVVSIMKRVEVPSFQFLFSPYSLERCKGVDVIPEVSTENEYYLFFKLDLQKSTEIIGAVMGAYSVHLCIFDSNNAMQYYMRIIDEVCLIVDYTDNDYIIQLLNSICERESALFKPCSSITLHY